MKILIYISHPAQFHFFKNAIRILKDRGLEILILIKTKDILQDLIEDEGWEFINIETKERKKGRFFILISLLKRDFKLFKLCIAKRPKLMLGTDASIAHVGWILRIPVITTLEDDYQVIKHLARLTYPFTTHIFAPNACDVGKWKAKKIGYDGYMKLAYLHPNWFVPDSKALVGWNDERFFVIRLSGLKAHHDFGIGGISINDLRQIINTLKPHGKVIISSEKELPIEFNLYLTSLPISKVHHYLYFAELLVSDSQSMSVEAAMLGTPSIRISDFAGKISVLEELENKYKLTFGFKSSEINSAQEKIKELLSHPNLSDEFFERRKEMLDDKIDVSAYLIKLISEFPDSIKHR